VLEQQPEARWIVIERTNVAQGRVRCAGELIPVVARGDLAKTFAKVPGGTRVKMSGQLRRMAWKTGDRQPHEMLVVYLERIERCP